MNGTWNVAVLVGSLRKASFTRLVANALADVAPPALNLEQVEIGTLDLYNQDFDDEGTVPDAWRRFRETMADHDAVLFVTPEYNRSVPGVLKNAIDVGSRPYGRSVWSGKPAAVVSVSPGALSGFGANHHLRQSLVFLDMPTLQQPEAYVGGAGTLFDPAGRLTNDTTREFLRRIMVGFADWIERTAPRTAAA
jgi:chromate reductase